MDIPNFVCRDCSNKQCYDCLVKENEYLKEQNKTLDNMLDSDMCCYCDFMNEKLNEYIDKTKFAEGKLYKLFAIAQDMRHNAVGTAENEWIVWNCAADKIVDVVSDQDLTLERGSGSIRHD